MLLFNWSTQQASIFAILPFKLYFRPPELNFASKPAKTGGIFEATLLKTERLEDEEEMADGCNTIQEETHIWQNQWMI